jgi:hypothetical protein
MLKYFNIFPLNTPSSRYKEQVRILQNTYLMYWNDRWEIYMCDYVSHTELQMCRCADVQMCRCADVHMCRCADVGFFILFTHLFISLISFLVQKPWGEGAMRLVIKISHNESVPWRGSRKKCLSKNSDYVSGRSSIRTAVPGLYSLEQRTLFNRSRTGLKNFGIDYIRLR